MYEPRVDLRARVRVRIDAVDPASGDIRATFHTLDLSSGGALCVSDREESIRTQLRLRIHLPDDPNANAIGIDAIVLRAERSGDAAAAGGPCRVALYFLNLRPEDRQRLQRFVFAALAREGAVAPAAAPAPAPESPAAASPRRPRRK
jgi:c-di-GMP-binding flagellar brake protein YcgR